jgi:hypothetical protein
LARRAIRGSVASLSACFGRKSADFRRHVGENAAAERLEVLLRLAAVGPRAQRAVEFVVAKIVAHRVK